MRAGTIARALPTAIFGLATLIGLVYAIAWLNLDSSTLARALIWMAADFDDHKRFPARTIAAGDEPFRYPTGSGYPDALPPAIAPGHPDLAAMLVRSRTTAFIVVKDGRLLYERYFNGYDRESTGTSFSISKSYLSALVGIAIADGLIGGLDDPVTAYVPELRRRDAGFDRITIRHLLAMASGLRYEETRTPWGDNAKTYYAPDLRELALEETEIVEPPGRRFHYNNFNAILIGLILERLTGRPVSEYLSDKIWKPLGAEAEATWSLDSAKSGFEKMESGINARAIDFIKLGSLYLNRGRWRGKQVVPADWVEQSTRTSAEADPSPDYQYGWWTFRGEELGDYFTARGTRGQFVFVFPKKDLVILRQGIELGGIDWVSLIPQIARRL